jgi:hypothetical protein
MGRHLAVVVCWSTLNCTAAKKNRGLHLLEEEEEEEEEEEKEEEEEEED